MMNLDKEKWDLVVSAPARICLMGEHQDYYGLASITAAINLRINIYARARTDSILAISLPDINENENIDLHKPPLYANNRDYLRSGIKVMQCKGFKLPSGYDVVIKSHIPIAKGISSSSALIVAWITFLANASGCNEIEPSQIARNAFQAEVIEFSEAGGMMDQFSSAFGGLNHIDCMEPYTVTPLKFKMSGFLLGDTLTTKDTQGVLSNLKNQVLNAVEKLKLYMPDFSLRNTSLETIKPYMDKIPSAQARKLQATLINRDLTRKTFNLFQKFDRDNEDFQTQFAHLVNLHHQALKNGLEISTPFMEKMREKALNAGALACKVNGSGGGGFLLVYAPGKTREVARSLKSMGANAIPVNVDPGVTAIISDRTN